MPFARSPSVFYRLLILALAFFCASFRPSFALSYQPGEKPFTFESTPGALSKFVVPKRSQLVLELDPYVDTFKGVVTHIVDVRRPAREIRVNNNGLAIQSARWGDVALATSSDNKTQMLTMTAPREMPVGEHRIEIAFSGKMTANGYGLYFARYKDASGNDRRMLATQMEPIGTREMVPSFDEPSFRTEWDVSIIADLKYTALSNMHAIKESLVNGKRKTDFATTPSMASYLLAIALGEFEKTTDRFENTELNIYTVATKHRDTAYAMDATKKVLAYFKDYFGAAYPLKKLDQIAVPGKRGAMENWGLITYSEDGLIVNAETAAFTQKFWSFNVIAHEIAHQWFGNLVTMAWWDGLWLNESFAEWMAHKATAALNPEWNLATKRADAKARAMELDVLSNATPIERAVERDQASDSLFDSLTYQKGHAVLNMIERYAGETVWRDGIRDYMKKHAYSNATSADLWAAITARTSASASGRDVQAFANSWTRQAGFPLIDALVRCEKGQQTLTLQQSRFALKPGYVPSQTWNLAVLVSQPLAADRATQTAFITLQPKEINAGACGSPIIVDAGGDGYYRVRYDEASFAALRANSAKLSMPDRLRIMSDRWALSEAGLAAPADAFAMIDTLAANDAPELWSQAIAIYGELAQLVRYEQSRGALEQHAQRNLNRAFSALGWTAKATDNEATRALRGDLIGALGAYGDAKVIAESRARFAAIERGEAMDGDVRTGVLRAVGVNAANDDIKRMFAILVSDKDAALQWPLMDAMTSARDPKIAANVLEFAFSEQIPKSLAQRMVGRVARNGFHDALAFDFVSKNLEKLFGTTSQYGRRYIFAAPLEHSRNIEIAKEIAALASKHLEADARVEVSRGVAGAERNAWAYDAVKEKLSFLTATKNTL